MIVRKSAARRMLVLGLALTALIVPSTANAASGDLIPDLRMARLRDMRIQVTSNGARLLRFSSTIVNEGDGRFVVHGNRSSTGSPWIVRQKIKNADGSYRWIRTTAGLQYTGDGHDHWHIKNMASYELFALTDTGTALRRGAKVGFCFFDTTAHNLSLPGAPQRPKYRESTCGIRNSTHIWMGLSHGWGDTYPWNFYKQWIDISGVPAGRYRVCVTTDKANRFRELNESNNATWTDISIGARGTGLTVLGWGRSSCQTRA
ncbi:MAG: hypothetical protein H0V12_03565 [Chloroflexi bacterium]|jgi:hypothetical protein|nr:hypothetical protein [Chloroflexota bacterium]